MFKEASGQNSGPSPEAASVKPLQFEADQPAKAASTDAAAAFTRNSLLSVARLFVSTAVALVLPSFLTHKLSVTTYGAWVLIIQMGAYVGYLDFGIQTGIAKYVAEYEARKDSAGSSMRASAGLAMMVLASVAGVILTLVLAWRVPSLFHEMPSALYHDVRLSLFFVGVSLSFGLLCSIYSSIFLGLQNYVIPMALSILNRILYTAVVFIAVSMHRGLAVMGALVAVVNIATGLLQFEAWRRFARHVQLSFRGLDWSVVRKMLSYCSSLAIWTAGMLCVSGLDVVIVGRYDFGQTSFYSIATLPTTFAIAIMSSALSPLLPTASALSVSRTPLQMGDLLSKMTRYASLLLLSSGLPLLVAGYWILKIWVGPNYAVQSLPYLRILVIANLVRNLCMPYASMLVATDNQRAAIAGAVTEAVVNLASSIYLARRFGAMGVAYGTLIGSSFSVGMHFAVSMHYTFTKFSISRIRLLMTGFIRPSVVALPSLLLLPLWWRLSAPPAFQSQTWIAWVVSTLLLAWFVALNPSERVKMIKMVRSGAH